MKSENEIEKIFYEIKSKLKDEKIQKLLSDFSKKIQFIFSDKNKSYYITIINGKIESINEGNIDSPDIQIRTEIKILNDILNKKINPMSAYASGKLKAKGKLTDLLKIIKLL